MSTRRPNSLANQVAAAREEADDIPVSVALIRGNVKGVMASSIDEGEESDLTAACCSHADCGCADAMHELANSVTALLINTQVLGWKLPAYSRLKRLAREIQRQALRSGALLKSLLGRVEGNEVRQESCWHVPFLHEATVAVSAQGLVATDERGAKLPLQKLSLSACGPDFLPKGNSHRPVTAALVLPSRKRNDSHEC